MAGAAAAQLTNGLQRREMLRPVVAAAVVVDLASYYVACVLCLAVALVITAARGEASRLLVFRGFRFWLRLLLGLWFSRREL